jgi:hypothetical protein
MNIILPKKKKEEEKKKRSCLFVGKKKKYGTVPYPRRRGVLVVVRDLQLCVELS